jgi:predicted NAD-dependent protein-ADP-ribosyltransferase YbiA (DUF1768 family)
VEALFQSLRFEGQPLIQEELRNCGSPMGAKMIARRERALLNRTGIWDYVESDRELMKRCLRLKLQQHPELELRLIETGEAIIIEDCTTHDREAARIWGQVKVKGKWVGQNILGQLWMELITEFGWLTLGQKLGDYNLDVCVVMTTYESVGCQVILPHTSSN